MSTALLADRLTAETDRLDEGHRQLQWWAAGTDLEGNSSLDGIGSEVAVVNGQLDFLTVCSGEIEQRLRVDLGPSTISA
jgi:hypothetical protein